MKLLVFGTFHGRCNEKLVRYRLRTEGLRKL